MAEHNKMDDRTEAEDSIFPQYKQNKSPHTLRRHEADLAKFTEYLTENEIPAGDLFNQPRAWQTINWHQVAEFQKWMLQHGYSVRTVNARLSAVKIYARLATRAGVLDKNTNDHIQAIEIYQRSAEEGRKLKRKGYKKPSPIELTIEQVHALKEQPDTPQGHRDRLLMCLLLDHGLRSSEIAALQVENFDLINAAFSYDRPATNSEVTQEMTPDTLKAAKAYIKELEANQGPLLVGSKKSGQLTWKGLSTRAITKRIALLGIEVGYFREVEYTTPKKGKRKTRKFGTLSAYDCRNYAVTRDANSGRPLEWLMEKYGWTSQATPLNYLESNHIVRH
ncbi:MAG: tyrosine-type recombinase/integrase [Anaerolineales bacterium]|nr:tyrosine-type recombinase/integrase [Anaerolineales bacterium]